MTPLPLDPGPTTSSSRPPFLASSGLGMLGKAALAVICLAAVAWPLLEALLLIDRLRWKYVRWGLVLDEQGHDAQILSFLHGDFVLFKWPDESYPTNAMIPGFHALLAAIAHVTGLSSRRTFRLVC